MPESLFAVDGTSFLLSDRSGDIRGGTEGLFVRDARYLSRWRLLLDGRAPVLLTSHHVDTYSGLVFMMNAEGGNLPPNSVSVQRRRTVGGGMEEELRLQNHLDVAVEFSVRLDVDADFLDLFEVKDRHFANPQDHVFAEAPAAPSTGASTSLPEDQAALRFEQARGAYSACVTILADPMAASDGHGLTWSVKLEPRGVWLASLAVRLEINGEGVVPRHGTKALPPAAAPDRSRGWLPSLRTEWADLQAAHYRSCQDILTLLIDEPDLASGLPAAGLPWFMTVFGRDTLLTAYQLLPACQEMGWIAIDTLARLQATTDDPDRDAEPGKILHELRRGPTAVNGGHFPYYGTVDATMLFVILLHELWRWSGDDQRARQYRPAAEAALGWMGDGADVDRDGFIEWHRRCPTGLENQAWKDSWDAYRRRDGRIATGPIASCEVQGYAFDAYTRAAELADGPWNDPGLAGRLRERAGALHTAFNERFWTEERGGYYHLALDGAKQPVDSLTSNMGHLLWSGIVPADRAPLVARQLVSPALFSGWGIRTMSTDDLGFNPISYHCGTVWPHDNSIAAMGLRRYGFHEEVNLIFTAMIEASRGFHHRLPEVFAGYGRDVAPFPVEYPTASSPQAWACGAPLLLLRAALGLEPDGVARSAAIEPHLPALLGDLELTGLSAFGRPLAIEIAGDRAVVRKIEPGAPDTLTSMKARALAEPESASRQADDVGSAAALAAAADH